ncbi:Transcriptional regulator RPN4 [Cyphellophora attinorum]|uniref:Transcriptional regulator RPN4 n=1 Tax=Cyphellophora attinorum TaxID=1664694 RepID=A0A0N1HM98_9EURO|nr:Transcriptional regulator RPN4 [Phialophora attinorum]KPI35845.1 Transcriptional regulator RPN4 [Phialophora attinorum]
MAGGWNDNAYLSALPKNLQHKRLSSDSSIASAGGPPSPLSHNTLYPHIATSDSTFPTHYEFDYTPHSAKSLPSELPNMYNQNYRAMDMRRIPSSGADNLSAPQSLSTMSHNSPATPHTNYETDYDEKQVYGEIDSSDEEMARYLQMDLGYQPTVAYQQSLQEVFPDQFTFQTQPMPRLNPDHRQTTMAGRLQAATQDHMSSPTSNPRGQSPFRQNSPYVVPGRQAVTQPTTLQKTRTSVSPKELMLDEHDIDESAAPLFQNQYGSQSRRNPSNLSNYYTPSFNAEPSVQIPQQYPFVSQQSRDSIPDSTPEFPAHLISMESTNEEGPSASSSQQSRIERQPIQRPADTTSESGTYSCTYHGCSERFETPAKLQKHKREGHRQVSPQSAATASANLALRNSQAGPHRCDRINPSTGKPCNSIFSRPYDLTRHEDTIHNGRKIKVRCHLCVEEKTSPEMTL